MLIVTRLIGGITLSFVFDSGAVASRLIDERDGDKDRDDYEDHDDDFDNHDIDIL